MFRSLLYGVGVNLRRKRTAIIYAESSASSISAPPAKYLQNPNVVISNSRVSFIACSFCTTTSDNNSNLTCSDSDSSSFVVSYLINSCGLSETEAITASRKLIFKTKSQPDSVIALFKTYGFTESHISELIPRHPAILSSHPDKNLKPKLDFFKSKGLNGIDLGNFISKEPKVLSYSFNNGIVPAFDILKTIVHSDQNVVKLLKRCNGILSANQGKKVMVNLELLRDEGVPQTSLSKYLIQQPRMFTNDADTFKEIVQKVKGMGFDHLQTTFLKAVHGLASMTEASWRKKMDVYKRWGWSEDQIQTAFRKIPFCMRASEKKIMAVMDFLVNEMGYDSSSVAENPIVFTYSLKDRIIPRCSVIRILVSKGLIQENIPINSLSVMVDEYFLEKFVKNYKQQVPELIKVFNGQLKYDDLG